MSELKERIRTDLTTSMKARDEVRTRTLRMVLSEISKEEVSGAASHELNEGEIMRVLSREVKRRREAAEAKIPQHLLYTEGWPRRNASFTGAMS